MTGPELPRLLIADDDERLRSALEQILASMGFRVRLARDGSEALAIVEYEPVDCMLLDVQMPGLTGLELLAIVREQQIETPCVMLTAERNAGVLRQALALRVYTVLEKPVSKDLITLTVRRALSRMPRSA